MEIPNEERFLWIYKELPRIPGFHSRNPTITGIHLQNWFILNHHVENHFLSFAPNLHHGDCHGKWGSFSPIMKCLLNPINYPHPTIISPPIEFSQVEGGILKRPFLPKPYQERQRRAKEPLPFDTAEMNLVKCLNFYIFYPFISH